MIIKRKYDDKAIIKYIFIFTFFISIVMGIIITYNYNFKASFNLLFDSDTGRVIGDASEIIANHSRLNVHPLYTLIIQPIVLLLSGITHNKILSIIIISALTSSLSVVYIYKILSLFNHNKIIKIIVSLCYYFAFSNLVFTIGIETYNVASFFLILLWYFTIKKLKDKKITAQSYILFAFLGLLSISITITNFIIFLINMFILFIFKKLKLKYIITTVCFSLLTLVILTCFQKMVWHTTPLIWESNLSKERGYTEEISLLHKINNVMSNDLSNSIISNKLKVKVTRNQEYDGYNYKLDFQKSCLIKILIIIAFYLLVIVILKRNFKKNLIINSGLLLCLIFNFVLHIIYGNECSFLYSLHFLYIIYLILGINLSTEKNEQVQKKSIIILLVILFIQIINNSHKVFSLLLHVNSILDKTYLASTIGMFKAIIVELIIILIISIMIALLIHAYKKMLKERNKEKRIIMAIIIFTLITSISCVFISLESTEKTNILLWKKLKPNSGQVTPPNKIHYIDSSLNNHFKREVNSLNNYIAEYKEFLSNYNTVTVENLNTEDYYYFGLGNRRKLIYKNNSIIDIFSQKKIITFNVKEYVIIPNDYTVIIKTYEGKFIKIYEDNNGVHYDINGKDTIIKGTDNYISLYTFKGQKYQNIKKTLYGEILFNIKDSKIYPNILVYKHPWYRDAAISTMVLKQTNNTDLIKEWVDNISEIYDKQNNGECETDNLGELLYIISSQSEINHEMIEKIEEEAERIAIENPDGYYLNGKTDFSNQNLYQNLWYKLGAESVGIDFDFEINELNDSYSHTAWWSDYQTDEFNYEVNKAFPYLTAGYRHKKGNGDLVVNKYIYPLSWEQYASSADYNSKRLMSAFFKEQKISPLHTWSASELILFLLDETGDLH